MYNELLNELEAIKGQAKSENELNALFAKYGWICMGFSTKTNELIYIESPMGKEINLVNTIDKEGLITIIEIKKMFWD